MAYGLYMVVGKIVDNFRREDKYWDKFKQFAPQKSVLEDGKTKLSLSKWEHNKRAIAKMLGRVNEDGTLCPAPTGTTIDKQNEEIAKAITSGTMNPQAANVADVGN